MGVRERYARRPPMPPDVLQRLAGLEALFRRHPLRLAYLGGAIARGDPCAADVDLAVLPEEDLSLPQLYADLSLALGTDRLDLVALRAAPPGTPAGDPSNQALPFCALGGRATDV